MITNIFNTNNILESIHIGCACAVACACACVSGGSTGVRTLWGAFVRVCVCACVSSKVSDIYFINCLIDLVNYCLYLISKENGFT